MSFNIEESILTEITNLKLAMEHLSEATILFNKCFIPQEVHELVNTAKAIVDENVKLKRAALDRYYEARAPKTSGGCEF